MPAQKTYSLKVELSDETPDHYYVLLKLEDSEGYWIHDQVRLDMLFEQVQTRVDNVLRRLAAKLTAEMKHQRKQNQKWSNDNV